MIDFMLQDTRVPPRGLDNSRRPGLVEALDPYPQRSRHNCSVSWDTETSFEKLRTGRRLQVQYGIDDYVKRNGPALALGYLLRSEGGEIFLFVFDDGELQCQSHLRRSQSDRF